MCRAIGNSVALCLSVSYSTNKCKSSLFLQPLFAYKRTTFLSIFLCKASKGISEKKTTEMDVACCRICKCHDKIDSKAHCVPNASCVRPMLAFEWWHTVNSLTGSAAHTSFWIIIIWEKAQILHSSNPQRFTHLHMCTGTHNGKQISNRIAWLFFFSESSYLLITQTLLRALHPLLLRKHLNQFNLEWKWGGIREKIPCNFGIWINMNIVSAVSFLSDLASLLVGWF